MPGASSWNCPICLRRVPARVSECYCGRKRQPEDDALEPERRSRGLLLALGTLALVVLGVWALRPAAPAVKPAPAPAPIPPTSRPAGDRRPRLPGEGPPTRVRGPWPVPWIASTPTPEPSTEAQVPASTPTPPLPPTQPPQDSADARRERGALAFEAAMRNLSGRLGQLRGEIAHLNRVCPREATNVIGCEALRGEVAAAARGIKEAIEAAEDEAHRSWVTPGARRQIRDRSGMDETTVGEALAAAAAVAR